MADRQSADLQPLVSREQGENEFRRALALFAGRGRRYSIEQLAKGIGLFRDGKPHTKPLYDFLSYPSGHPDNRPLNFGLILSIAKFLGADFTNEWLCVADQGAFDLCDDDPDPGEMAAGGAEDSAAIVRAAVDGKFDQHEKADLRIIGARKIKRGQQLLALGRAA